MSLIRISCAPHAPHASVENTGLAALWRLSGKKAFQIDVKDILADFTLSDKDRECAIKCLEEYTNHLLKKGLKETLLVPQLQVPQMHAILKDFFSMLMIPIDAQEFLQIHEVPDQEHEDDFDEPDDDYYPANNDFRGKPEHRRNQQQQSQDPAKDIFCGCRCRTCGFCNGYL